MIRNHVFRARLEVVPILEKGKRRKNEMVWAYEEKRANRFCEKGGNPHRRKGRPK